MESRLLRKKIRNRQFKEPTCGFAEGFTQTNLVVVPKKYADDFELFCKLNPKPCPLIERLEVGSFEPKNSAPDADLRTDLVLYKKFINGEFIETLSDLNQEWKDDLVSFLLGCSFTFEAALKENGIYMPHYEQKGNVAMYSTNIDTVPTTYFSGPLVVSMRWIPEDQVDEAVNITGRYTKNHGSPIHTGNPLDIGIPNIKKPDFGQYWDRVNDTDVPVFWACGVTPQQAVQAARVPLVFTHSPGYMFVTDLKEK